LLAASFREKKGLPDALEALGRLHRELRDLQITIIGDADSDPRSQPEKARILAKLEEHHLQPKVRLLGYQSHAVLLTEAYKHHLFAAPSLTAADGDTEGGAPVTLIEMVATGMPVISTNHCDIPSVVIDGTTGLLANEKDVEGLLCHLRWFVAHPEQWEEMARAGRSHVEANYDAIKQAHRLRDLYVSLLAAKQPS
jgi:colanic acid/amylovoran biosynthesis glycosyltransferase